MERTNRNLWLLWAGLGDGLYTVLVIMLGRDLNLQTLILLTQGVWFFPVIALLFILGIAATNGRLHWLALLSFVIWILMLSGIQLVFLCACFSLGA
ncbi:MAG: hypothetical protein C0478_01175 [Planctomyces sp.]|nr:hypothetical protein [Planctomyces sp.]